MPKNPQDDWHPSGQVPLQTLQYPFKVALEICLIGHQLQTQQDRPHGKQPHPLSFLSLLVVGGGAQGPEGILHSHLGTARIQDLSHKERRLHRHALEIGKVMSKGAECAELNWSHIHTKGVLSSAKFCSFIFKKKKKWHGILIRNTYLSSDRAMWFIGLDSAQEAHRSLFKEYSPEVRLRSWVTENGHNIINSIYLQTNCGHWKWVTV